MKRLMLSWILFCCTQADTHGQNLAEQKYSSLVVFGASSEDNGNWTKLMSGIAPQFVAPAPPYLHGRATNGITWVEHLAPMLEVPVPTASDLGGASATNYAFSGATTDSSLTRAAVLTDLDEQIPKFLRDNVPSSNQLFVVSGGINDIVGNPDVDPEIPADFLAKRVSELAESGAQNFLVTTFRARPGFEEARIREFNVHVREHVNRLRDELGVAIYLLDNETHIDDIVANPENYGLTNAVGIACDHCIKPDGSYYPVDTMKVVDNPDKYLYWDNHLTTRGYELIAQFAFESLTISGDVNQNGGLSVADLDMLTSSIRNGSTDLRFDLDGNEHVNDLDRSYWITNIANTYFGDSNLDGQFDSGDLVDVFKTGQYEDDFAANSTWATGDWNGDGEFDTGDLVEAFKDGGFELGRRDQLMGVPEPSCGVLVSIAIIGMCRFRRFNSLIRDSAFS